MLKGFLLKFSGLLGAGEELLVFLAVVVVDTFVGVVLTTDVEVGLSLLSTDVEVGLSLLATDVEVGLSLLATDVEVGLSVLNSGGGVVVVPLPPTIVGGNIT